MIIKHFDTDFYISGTSHDVAEFMSRANDLAEDGKVFPFTTNQTPPAVSLRMVTQPEIDRFLHMLREATAEGLPSIRIETLNRRKYVDQVSKASLLDKLEG